MPGIKRSKQYDSALARSLNYTTSDIPTAPPRRQRSISIYVKIVIILTILVMLFYLMLPSQTEVLLSRVTGTVSSVTGRVTSLFR